MDECKNCIVRGDLDECIVTPCNIRKSWFSIVMMERNAALTIDNAALKLEVDDMKRTLSIADIEIERSRTMTTGHGETRDSYHRSSASGSSPIRVPGGLQ